MSIVTEITRINTNIANSYTAVDNKNGTLPQVQNSANLASAIDSIEVIEQATAEGESLSLTNTKAMPYSDYVVKGKSEQEGEPSPSNPSEIHSVADDVNLLNLDNCTFDNCTLNKDGSIKSNINNSYFCVIETTQLNSFLMQNLGKSFIFSIKDAIENKYISIVVYGSRTGGGTFQEATVYSTSRKITIPLANDFTNITKIAFRVNRSSTSFTDTTTVIKELKFEKGSTPTSYSPYNQGTVTIKQRGKNLFDLKAYLTNRGVTYIENSDGSITFSTTINLYSNTFTFSSSNTNVSLSGIITNGTATNGRIQLLNSSNVVVGEITSSKINYENLNANQLRFNYSTSGTITLKNIQLEEGSTATPYEPYQGYDKVFQTEPLRSLPNGVKDTIEADGIHRRVGRVVFDGTESGWYKQDNTSYSEDYLRFTIGITDKKNASNPNSKKDNILSNNFTNKILDNNPTRKTNSITGQFSTNLINIFVAQNIINGSRVDDFKTWLSTHNTEVLYELAEEVIEPLTQNQATTMLDIIKTGSYEGTTNIYTDEDVKPTMKVVYYKKA